VANEPLIRLEPGGRAPILSYNVPEPTSYAGRNFIELDYSTDFFTEKAFEIPPEAFAERTWAGVPPLLSGSAGRRRVGFADFRLSHGVYFPISTCSGQTPGVIRPAPAHA
jgi:hypothetical protein